MKKDDAITTCEKVVSGLEDGSLPASRAAMLCLRIARLTNDVDSIDWLSYENGGYPTDSKGLLEGNAFAIGCKHGRGYISAKDGKTYMFCQLITELESSAQSCSSAISSFSTSGASAGGEYSNAALNNFEVGVHNSIVQMIQDSRECTRKATILRGQYYDFALKKMITLKFGNAAEGIFDLYSSVVNNYLNSLSTGNVLKIDAIQDSLDEHNPEKLSQAVTSCRRLLDSVSTDLFFKVAKDSKSKIFKSSTGKDLDISGDHYLNRLSAIAEIITNKSGKNTLVGSSVIYLCDIIENINDEQCKGVHKSISIDEARSCVLLTYSILGNLLINYHQAFGDAVINPSK
jgi:hypothetical protein